MSHKIALYTHGRLSTYRDEETGALVFKDTQTGIEYGPPPMIEDLEEMVVFLMAAMVESSPSGSTLGSLFGMIERT